MAAGLTYPRRFCAEKMAQGATTGVGRTYASICGAIDLAAREGSSGVVLTCLHYEQVGWVESRVRSLLSSQPADHPLRKAATKVCFYTQGEGRARLFGRRFEYVVVDHDCADALLECHWLRLISPYEKFLYFPVDDTLELS